MFLMISPGLAANHEIAEDGNARASPCRPMKRVFHMGCATKRCLIVLSVMMISTTPLTAAEGKEVLVVTVTTGFRHPSIAVAEQVLEQLAVRNNLSIDFARTVDDLQEKMTRAGLQKYDLIVFANTTGDLPLPDRDAFLGWIAAGHAFVGVHSASDTFHGYPPYLEMLGGEFQTHGDQSTVVLEVVDREHPSTRELPSSFTIFEEIYQFQRFELSRVRLLIALDRHPNTGEPGLYPISWSRSHGRGRVFYTALGHREDVWLSTEFQQHLEGGVLWAITPSRRRPARPGSSSP